MKQYLYKIGFLLLAFALTNQYAYAVNTYSMMPLGDSPNTYLPQIGLNTVNEVDLEPEAKLKVRNNSGNTDMYSGTTFTTFTFDGNGSSDAETANYLLEVRFDFENDGKLDTYYSTIKHAEHSYSTPGLKTVRMDVLDSAGHVTSAYKQILIVENTKPEAYFTIEPSIGTPGTEFKLDCSESKDDQYSKNLLEFRYDYNGDGNWDTKYSKIGTRNHYFNTPGLKNVTLQVRDPEGFTDEYTYTVYIKPNKDPHADFEVNTSSDGRIVVDAQNSYDPESEDLKYRWDFDFNGENDIQYNTPWLNSGIASHVYTKPGEYLIKLIVKDPDSAIAIKIMRIFVDILS